ncbi:MAG: 16S rRNA (uracil(1498)-N(3))-methyltransferase [Eubacteriales bacterium]
MHKFFVTEEHIHRDHIIIAGEDAGHIAKSLRMKKGEKIQVSNGQCQEYLGEITSLSKSEVRVSILQSFCNVSESKMNITLYQGVTKGSKMDLIIQKGVELGVKRFVPVITERTIIDIDNKSMKKVERWQKIAIEAAKQSKRGMIPSVNNILYLKDLQSEFKKNELNIIAYEEEKKVSLKKLLDNTPFIKNTGLLIGPEGGLTKDEVQFLGTIGGKCITLGERILRTETAGFSIVSMLTYHYEM